MSPLLPVPSFPRRALSRAGLAACGLLALLAGPPAVRAEAPTLITYPLPPAAQPSFSEILPVPAEDEDPAHKAAFEEVVAEARANDVSVTPENAILYHGLLLLQDEDYEGAVPFLEEAIRRDPALQAAWEGLGWSYIKTDRFDEADRLWNYFQQLMPDEAAPYSLLAQLDILRRDWPAADEHFTKSLSIAPDQYDVSYWYAQNLMRIGRVDDAETVFRRLLEANPDRLDVAIDLAALLVQRLRYDEAAEWYERINEGIPDNPRFLLDQADIELRLGDLEEADRLVRAVLELDPGNARAMRLACDLAELAGDEDPKPFLDSIEATDDPIVRAGMRMRLANRCHLANERVPGTHDESFILELIETAVEEDPGNTGYRIFLGERLLQAGDIAGAHRLAIEVLSRDNPANLRARMLLFNIAVRDRRFDDAEQILSDTYERFDPGSAALPYHLATLELARGRYREALVHVDELEKAANRGTVLTLLYHDLTESDWVPTISVRRLHEHLAALRREGWKIVAPSEIPDYLDGKADNAAEKVSDDPPATARFFDFLLWCVTGKRRFPPEDAVRKEFPAPQKVVAVTFDDMFRSALELGSEVAEDFGVPFGYFVPTEPPADYAPARATWGEIREAARSGNWEIGSEMYAAHVKRAVDADGTDLRAPLVNRLWVERRRRLESMNEWDRRLRRECRESARILEEELGSDLLAPRAMVAYPFGDVGQESSCNIASTRNVSRSVLAEAGRTYEIGFVPAAGGYATAGENPLLMGRYEPSWSDGGDDVVRHAYEFHPLFAARRLRAVAAMRMDKPNLALEMLGLLRRDGYPEVLCRQLENDIRTQFKNRPPLEVRELIAPALRDGGAEGTNSAARAEGRYDVREGLVRTEGYRFSPTLQATGENSKANDQIESYGASLAASVNLPADWTVSAKAGAKQLKQVVRPFWNAVYVTNVTYEQSRYTFKTEETAVTGTLSHRTESGAVLSASGGVVSRKQKTKVNITTNFNLQDGLNSHEFVPAEDESKPVFSLSALWHPLETTSFLLFYDHGYVLSAVKNILYDSVAARVGWRPSDRWEVESRAQYWTYEDDNAMFSAFFESLWELDPARGVWAGVQASTVSTSEGCDYYWTPYWDKRLMGIVRYRQSWEGFHASLDFLAGFSRTEGRGSKLYEAEEEETKDVTTEGIVNTVTETKTVYVEREDPGSDWHLAWGVAGKLERRLNSVFTLSLEGDVVALREYIDHAIVVSLSAQF